MRLNSRDLCGGNDTSPQLLSGNGKPAEDLSKMDNKPTSTDDPETDKVEYKTLQTLLSVFYIAEHKHSKIFVCILCMCVFNCVY